MSREIKDVPLFYQIAGEAYVRYRNNDFRVLDSISVGPVGSNTKIFYFGLNRRRRSDDEVTCIHIQQDKNNYSGIAGNNPYPNFESNDTFVQAQAAWDNLKIDDVVQEALDSMND